MPALLPLEAKVVGGIGCKVTMDTLVRGPVSLEPADMA